MIEAKIICDSISSEQYRLTTFQLRYPRFIHSEFMTHRVISRNASSSRAIPTAKLIEEVRSDVLRASPVFWGKNQPGMQAAEELENKSDVLSIWRTAAIDASWHAQAMLDLGAHKQIVNRLLEPFSHINVVASATSWNNFFGLRLHKDAQPEMRELAKMMLGEMHDSRPKELKPGEWHLPFIEPKDWSDIGEFRQSIEPVIQVSVARCARVSYLSFETGKRSTIAEDINLCKKLLSAHPLHASPAEHQATPDEIFDKVEWHHPEQHGNFLGWRQFRKTLPGEACAPIPEEFLDDYERS